MSFFTDASFVMDPSVYRAGTLFVPKPTDGSGDLTFTRSSGATRVGPNGYIEKVRTNLLLQSNTFSTTWLNQLGGTITSGQAGYDGTNNAWLLSKDTSTFRSVRQPIGFAGVITYSAYAKAGTLSNVALRIDSSAGALQALYDLSAGTTSGIGGAYIDYGIESIGSGWYRIFVTANISGGTNVHIYVDRDGTTAGNILVQNAQLEAGDVATDYIPTTTTAVTVGPVANIPRLDYLGDNCPKLLLEPQRTNLITESERFDVVWVKTRCTATANTTISPDGYQNADTLTATDPAESYAQVTATPTASQVAFSFFAKKNNVNFVHSLAWDVTANGARQWFDIQNGTVGSSSTFGSGYSVASASIVDYGNGWYRCITIYNITSGVLNGFRASLSTVNDDVSSPIGSAQYFWGAQLEQGSYATSYIPTLGSAVTRNADAASKTGASSFIGQTEGTLFVEANLTNVSDSGFRGVAELNDGTTSNRITLFRNTSGTLRLFIRESATTQTDMTYLTAPSGNTKIAVGYKANDVVFYVNGVQVGTDTSATIPACSDFDLGIQEKNTNRILGDRISQALLFKTRLSNADLARLTSI